MVDLTLGPPLDDKPLRCPICGAALYVREDETLYCRYCGWREVEEEEEEDVDEEVS